MLDNNSKTEFSAELSVLKFLSSHKVPTRVVCQGSFTAKTKRQVMKSLSIYDNKYYIYFQGRYVDNPVGGKMSIFSSIVLVDWSTGDPVELEHQHIDTADDIKLFLNTLTKYLKEDE